MQTDYSRKSINYSIIKLIFSDRIKKSSAQKINHYYYIEDEENQSVEFMKQIIQEEKPQKIFQTIINSPSITQKELADTTGIPTTTLQWHLTQIAKYKAIKNNREKHHLLQNSLQIHLSSSTVSSKRKRIKILTTAYNQIC